MPPKKVAKKDNPSKDDRANHPKRLKERIKKAQGAV
eukprot:gene3802-14339_t